MLEEHFLCSAFLMNFCVPQLMTFCNHGHANHMKGFHLVFPGVPKEHLRRYRAQNAAT